MGLPYINDNHPVSLSAAAGMKVVFTSEKIQSTH